MLKNVLRINKKNACQEEDGLRVKNKIQPMFKKIRGLTAIIASVIA